MCCLLLTMLIICFRHARLAYCELYLCLAALALRVLPRMRLYGTTELDVRYDHDMVVPLTREDSKGVRVLVD